MLRITTLNGEISEDDCSIVSGEGPSKELQEEEFLSLYTSALQLQNRGDVQRAKSTFEELLELLNGDQTSNGNNLPDSIRVLQYSCYKNLGSISYETGEWQQAAEYLINASELDSSDVSLWQLLGKVAIELGNLPLARTAFQEGLSCSSMNWPCLDYLMLVSFALYDYLACLSYASKGLSRDPYYLKAIILRDQIFQEDPILKQDVRVLLNNSDSLLEPESYAGEAIRGVLEEIRVMRSKRAPLNAPVFESVALQGVLKEHTWTNLGECLLATHDFISKQEPPMSSFVPVNLSNAEEIVTVSKMPLEVQPISSEFDDAAKSSTEDGEVLLEDARRGSKRKRGLDEPCSKALDSREQKRRSTRSRGGLFRVGEDIDSLRAELRSYLPTSLLLDSCEPKPEDKQDQPEDEAIYSQMTKEKDVSGASEAIHVQTFIQESGNDECVLILLENLCAKVVTLDFLDSKLLTVFTSCFKLVRSSIDYMHLKWEEEQESREAIANKVEVLCVYVEVLAERPMDPPLPTHLPEDFRALFDACADQSLLPPHKFCELQCRVYWARKKYLLNLQETDAALYCLQQVEQILRQKSVQGFLAVTSKGRNWVSFFRVKQEMKSVERILHLQQVPALHASGQTETLIGLLQVSLSGDSLSASGRAGHITMLLEALCTSERWPEVLVWGAKCFKEATLTFVKLVEGADDEKKASVEQEWKNCISLLLTKMEDVIAVNDASLDVLEQSALADLAESLILLAAQQLDAEEFDVLPTLKPWIMLYRVLAIEEQRKGLPVEDVLELPGSLLFLTAVHDLLGRRNWCAKEEGGFLITTIRVFLQYGKSIGSDPNSPAVRALEQASYCLVGFPSKKSKNRALDEHSCSQVGLSWDLSLLLCESFSPSPLPQFDSLSAISSELEVLLKRVVELIPADLDPSPFLHVVEDYFNGSASSGPWEPIKVPPPVQDVFYLLADFYFKSKEWSKAVTHYSLDLLVNPRRFDSWAALALTKGTQLETAINSCGSVNIDSFLSQAGSTVVCYKEAMTLKPEHISVCIEYGCLAYTLQAFASRYLRLHTNSLSVDLFSKLLKHKDEMLELAHQCFLQAEAVWSDSSDDQDERWLHQYMLGKISEKRNGTPEEFLSHYIRAGELLKEAGAEYPEKISYNNPGNYAVEALEIHYRIHSSILKLAVEMDCEMADSSVLPLLNDYLQRAAALPLPVPNTVRAETETGQGGVADSAEVLNDIIILMDEIVGRVVAECEGTPLPEEAVVLPEAPQDLSIVAKPTVERLEVSDIISSCLTGIRNCVRRFPQHYKSLYRLAHHYFSSPPAKNVEAAREILLERRVASPVSSTTVVASEYLPKGVSGLFRDWRLSNFFNGIWRIPVNEIDRPGSFAAHMGRCITLLVDILKESKEYRLLLELTLALYPEPEPDRKYLVDFEREQVTHHAFTLMIQSLRERLEEMRASHGIKNAYGVSPSQNRALSLLMEIYRMYQRIERNMSGKEASIGLILQECYTLSRQSESKEASLQEVLQYCQAKHQADKKSARSTMTGSGRGRRPGSTVKRDSVGLPIPAKKLSATLPRAPKPPKVDTPRLSDNPYVGQNSMSSLLYMNSLIQAAAANPLYGMSYLGYPVMGANSLMMPETLDPAKMVELQAEYQRQWLQLMSPGFDLMNLHETAKSRVPSESASVRKSGSGSSKGLSLQRTDKDLTTTPTSSKSASRISSSNLSSAKHTSSYVASTLPALPALPKGISLDAVSKEWHQNWKQQRAVESKSDGRRNSLSLTKKPATVQQLLKDRRLKPDGGYADLKEVEIQSIIGQQMVEQRYRKYVDKVGKQGARGDTEKESPYMSMTLPGLNLSSKRSAAEETAVIPRLPANSLGKSLSLSDEIEIQPVTISKKETGSQPAKTSDVTQVITID